MKHGCHPANDDAWYCIKDDMVIINNEKSNCALFCDSIPTPDTAADTPNIG
jgi:hypothetical protein